MNTPKALRVTIAFMAVAMLSVALAACGTQSGGSTQAGSSAAAQSASASAASASAAQSASTQASTYDSKEVARLIEEAERYFYGVPGSIEADDEKAIGLYEQAIALGSPYAMYQRSLLYFASENEDYTKTMAEHDELETKAFETAMAMPADNDDANLAIGLMLSGTTQREKAIPYLESAAQGEEPFSTLAMMSLAGLYEKDNATEQAAAWYEKAIEAGCTRAISQLAQMYTANGSYQKAIAWYTKAIEAGYQSWYGLGTAYSLINDYDNAFKAYQQGYEAGSITCAYGLGTVYFVQKDADNALEYFRRYLDGRPKPTSEHYTDLNEQNIRKYVQLMLDKGTTDEATVARYLGADFMNK